MQNQLLFDTQCRTSLSWLHSVVLSELVSLEITSLYCHKRIKGVSFQGNCGAPSVGVSQDNLVLSTELTM